MQRAIGVGKSSEAGSPFTFLPFIGRHSLARAEPIFILASFLNAAKISTIQCGQATITMKDTVPLVILCLGKF